MAEHDRNNAPEDESESASAQRGEQAHPEPIELEPVQTPQPAAQPRKGHSAEEEVETCPDCGAAMEAGAEVCIRCGHGATAEDAAGPAGSGAAKRAGSEPADEDETAARPLVIPSRSPNVDTWLPIVLGGAALLALLIAHMAGMIGLFPLLRIEGVEVVPWGDRFEQLLRNLVLIAFWTGCGLAGLFMLSMMLERQFGDARLAALRMAAIMAMIRLAALLSVPGPRWVEWFAESAIQGAAFILLAALLFTISIRNAAILAAWTLMAILLLWLFSFAVQWALG